MRMLTRSLVVFLAAILCARAAPQNPLGDLLRGIGNSLGLTGAPGEVENHQNAPYTVLNRYQGYEERQYPSQKWACSRGASGSNGMFRNLFSYISGANSRGESIKMTVPVMTSHSLIGQGKDMCFYLEKKFQGNAPSPNDPSVRVVQMPTMTVFAKTIKEGYPNFENEGRKFQRELAGQAGIDTTMFYSMGYDSPWKVLNRRNEVMFKKL